MGFSKKSQTGITIWASLKPIKTKPKGKESEDEEEEEGSSTTPTAKEARIPERLTCPPAPRKRRPCSRCNFNGARDFFTPPDLESVFKLHVEKAN